MQEALHYFSNTSVTSSNCAHTFLFSSLIGWYIHFILSHLYGIFPTGMATSPSTHPEVSKPAPVNNIYINGNINKDDVGLATHPTCFVEQKKSEMKVFSSPILYIFSCSAHSVGVAVRCGVGGGSV